MRLTGGDSKDWETVRSFSNRWEAEMLQRFLESERLETWLLSEDAGGAYPGVTLTGYQLLVRVDDMARARQLIVSGAVPAAEVNREAVAGRLRGLLLKLLAMPCVTGEEGPIADWLEGRYLEAGERVQRIGNSVVVGEEDFDRPNVLLVGHLDVVPPTGADLRPRRQGNRIVGRGASDMKSGLAVAIDCFEDADLRAGAHNLLLVAYAGEEGPHAGNELGTVLAEVPEVADADLAIVLEPTDLSLQLGCLGTLHAEVTFRGHAAHSARPWHGENALTKAGVFLDELHRRAPHEVEVDGLVYREVFTATSAATRNAKNVVPDRFMVNVNYRFAPGRSSEEAEQEVRRLVQGRADVEITDLAPAALPNRDAPMVRDLIAALNTSVEPKQAWTDVGRFTEAGVPAVNFGPGRTAQAHQPGEYVIEEDLMKARDALARFLAGDEA